jgi:hypothetical protein
VRRFLTFVDIFDIIRSAVSDNGCRFARQRKVRTHPTPLLVEWYMGTNHVLWKRRVRVYTYNQKWCRKRVAGNACRRVGESEEVRAETPYSERNRGPVFIFKRAGPVPR